MIGKTLQEILKEKDMNVNELSKLIGVSNQTLYSIIKRDNMKIDFEVLLKICSALNVSVERFYSDFVLGDNKDDIKETATPVMEVTDDLYRDFYNMLIKHGLIKNGEDLTDRQADILIGIVKIINAAF